MLTNINRSYFGNRNIDFHRVGEGFKYMNLPDMQGVLKEQGGPMASVKSSHCIEKPGSFLCEFGVTSKAETSFSLLAEVTKRGVPL